MNAMTMDLTWAPPAGEYNAASDLVDRTVAAGFANKAAFIDPTRQITYRELQQRCNRFANGLRRLGIRREERIALITLDTVDMPVVFWGAIKAGIVPIPINTLLTPEFWTYMIEDSRAAAVVVSAELLDRVGPVLEAIRQQRPLHVIVSGQGVFPEAVNLEAFLGEGSDEALAAPTRADEVAFWLYSSGSTGAPKGTRHLHASPMYTARLFAQNVLKFSSEDVVFSAAKLFFAYGLGNSMSFPMSVGATAILLPDRPTPDSVVKVMRDHQPTIFCGVPTLFASMLANKDIGQGAGSDRLRLTTSAGEALPEEIGLRWQEKVGTEVIDGIGSFRRTPNFSTIRAAAKRSGSSDASVPGYEGTLIAAAVGGVPQAGDAVHFITGRTSAVGYWLQRAKTPRAFCGEWTYTGDKYRIGEDGFYYYCGRTDDMFKVSGIWVSPFEIESVLLTHASVLEAAVVGKEDTDGLVKPKAFVVLKPGAANSETLFEDLKAHVKNNAGAWKYPRWMEVREDLPKTATGKIQRFKLREES